MNKIVVKWIWSERPKSFEIGIIDSVIYLLPIAANKAPTTIATCSPLFSLGRKKDKEANIKDKNKIENNLTIEKLEEEINLYI